MKLNIGDFMFKKLVLASSMVAILAIGASAAQGIKFYSSDKDISGNIYNMIEKDISALGFITTDPHKRINDAYKKKYGSTSLDTLNFFPILHEDGLKILLEKEPRLAGFSPFNLLMYKKQGEKETHVGHLMPDTILDILQIEDKDIRKAYNALFPAIDKLVEKTVNGKISYVEYDKLPEEPMMHFELQFSRDGDLDDFIDTFQEEFEEKFEEKEYLIAGFNNLKEGYEDTDDQFDTYDAFWTYSLCHLKFSYTIFDGEKSRADSGVFAPCTMYMYIKKDSHQLVIGMPKLANWQAVNGITDKTKVDFIKHLDKDIPDIMIELGAKRIPSSKPTMTLEELKQRAVIIFREIDKKVNELEGMIKDLEEEGK